MAVSDGIARNPNRDVEGLPICLNQEVLLAHQEIGQRAGNRTAINRVEAVRINGHLNAAALTEAFANLVARHSALRTRFERTSQMPSGLRRLQLDMFARSGVCAPGLYRQFTLAPMDVPTPSVHRRRIESSASKRLIEELMWNERCASFDCAEPPLLRGTLLQCGRQEFVLIIAVPWVVCDESSFEILLKDLFAFYELAVDPGCDLKLPPTGHFCDFAVSQAEQVATNSFDGLMAYWEDRWKSLASCQIDANALAYAQRERRSVANGSICDTLNMTGSASARIRHRAERAGVAPLMLFMAAYSRFLSAATGQRRLAVWLNCENRTCDERDELVGWLANRHAVEIDLSSAPTDELTETCRVGAVEAQIHQELPLSWLWYHRGRNLERPGPPVKLTWRREFRYLGGGLQVKRMEGGDRRLPLSIGTGVVVTDQDDGFTVTMIHSSDKFHRSETARALLQLCESVEIA